MRAIVDEVRTYAGFKRFLAALNRAYCRYWHRARWPNEIRLPEGPFILVGNHRSGLDPLIVQAAIGRPLRFLMAKDYYEKLWYWRWFFNYIKAIPVLPGGANRYALQAALDALRQGWALCVFPEGEANPRIPLARMLPGALVLALESNVPLVPFYIHGVWAFDHRHLWTAFLQRGRACLHIGKPFFLPKDLGKDRSGLTRGLDMIRGKIWALRPYSRPMRMAKSSG